MTQARRPPESRAPTGRAGFARREPAARPAIRAAEPVIRLSTGGRRAGGPGNCRFPVSRGACGRPESGGPGGGGWPGSGEPGGHERPEAGSPVIATGRPLLGKEPGRGPLGRREAPGAGRGGGLPALGPGRGPRSEARAPHRPESLPGPEGGVGVGVGEGSPDPPPGGPLSPPCPTQKERWVSSQTSWGRVPHPDGPLSLLLTTCGPLMLEGASVSPSVKWVSNSYG